MFNPIIPIERAPEKLINALIDAGILFVTDEGVRCIEPDKEVRRIEKDNVHM